MLGLNCVSELIFTPRCIGCGIRSSGLCSDCQESWVFRQLVSHICGVTIFSEIAYSAVAGKILLAAKENGLREADEFMFAALDSSLQRFLTKNLSQPLLVPIPSQRSSNRRRGRNFVTDLAQRLGDRHDLQISEILIHSRKVADQSLLNSIERDANLSHALDVSERFGGGREVLLVDDLVTSGSTLKEAIRALKSSGFCVVGAITACVALPLR